MGLEKINFPSPPKRIWSLLKGLRGDKPDLYMILAWLFPALAAL
jgi:hypothetical protein